MGKRVLNGLIRLKYFNVSKESGNTKNTKGHRKCKSNFEIWINEIR